MFLGISYNKWHGILAALVSLIIFFFCFLTIFDLLTRVVGPGVSIQFIIFMGILVALLLQSLNESIQAMDPEVENEYGSWKNFQDNSKKDWKYFFVGIVVGQIVIGVFMTIYFYIKP